MSCPNYRLYLQLADVCWSSPTCIKPNVVRSLFYHVVSLFTNIFHDCFGTPVT
jgi:hypothetical protein